MKFSRLFFDDPPKFDDVKLNSRKEHLHRGLLLFLHEWESARCDFLFTLFYYDEESEATPSFTRSISPQKFVRRNTKRNESVIGKNENLAKISSHVVYFYRSEQQFVHFTCSL